MNIILATRNPTKALLVQSFFEGSGLLVRTLADVGIKGEAVEDGATLEQNALKKAWYAHKKSRGRVWTMADDTGLFINALGGAPGVYAARWAGKDASTEEIMRHCLGRLKGISDRSATFRTVVAVIFPGAERARVFTGEVAGQLLRAPRVSPLPKMPYSALFVPEGHERTWAEMTMKEQNAISHRGKAFRQVKAFLVQAR